MFDHHHDAKLVQLDIRNVYGDYVRPWDINDAMRKGTVGIGTVSAHEWFMKEDGEKPASHVRQSHSDLGMALMQCSHIVLPVTSTAI